VIARAQTISPSAAPPVKVGVEVTIRKEEPCMGRPDPTPELALDTIVQLLRTLGEFALDLGGNDVAAFRAEAEGWARHVAVADVPPGARAGSASNGRRDWEGVRRFVREYCKTSAADTGAVVSDLRQALWLFVHNLGEALSRDEESDADIRQRLARLGVLAQKAAAADLKREVLETLGGLSTLLDDRRQRQRQHVESMGQRLRALGNELESARREIDTDALTGLYNRKALDDYMSRTLEVARLFGHEAVLLLVDIDSFKGINDSHGHAAGDEALRKIADATVRVFLRKSDFVARYGGDELAVVLRETALRQAQALGERLLRGVRALQPEGPRGPFPVTVSIGIAPVARDDSMRGWIDRADRGLYAAKASGRDRLSVGGPD
jgi:diguanylate cyclase